MENESILLAEFLSLEKPKDKNFSHCYKSPIDNEFTGLLLFDSDWNWLMQVIEKIDNLRTLSSVEESYLYCVELYGDGARIMDGKTGGDGVIVEIISGGTWIDTAYKLAVEFVKWYNKNK